MSQAEIDVVSEGPAAPHSAFVQQHQGLLVDAASSHRVLRILTWAAVDGDLQAKPPKRPAQGTTTPIGAPIAPMN